MVTVTRKVPSSSQVYSWMQSSSDEVEMPPFNSSTLNSHVTTPPSGSYDESPLNTTSASVSSSDTIDSTAVGMLPMNRENEPSLFERLPSVVICS